MKTYKPYLVFFLLCFCAISANSKPTLKFRNHEFKIIQFTDLHWVESKEYQARNDSTLMLIKYILETEKPDLVVFTGDVVVSRGAAAAWKKVTQPMIDFKVPFVVAFGNHDTETDLSKQKMLQIIEQNPYNLTFNADDKLSGVGNCSLPVKAADEKTDKWILYFFDSHAYPKDTLLGSYDWIKNDQIQWYRQQSARYTAEHGRALPSVAFFHIPFPEFEIVRNQKNTLGSTFEPVCSPNLNSGLFTSFIEMKDILGVFVGHDHNNDFVGQLDRIWLVYGRKTGYNAAYKEILDRGARVIELHENDRKFDTYIRTLKQVSLQKSCE